MAIKHKNPTEERCYTQRAGRNDKHSGQFTPGVYTHVHARAPYNFIPLPEKVVPAPLPLPTHDRFYRELLTGWIECTLDTCSPVYIRGMLTEAQWRAFGQTDNEHLHDEEKKAKAAFFAKDGNAPVLPGSSLRGMLRTLVEIVGYGRMRWVAAQPSFTFRAMAAQANDPLKDVYKTAMKSGVRAGYFVREGEDWYIHPATLPSGNDSFIKVDDEDISKDDIPGFVPMFSKGGDYLPQIHPVVFKRLDDKAKSRELIEKAKKINERNERQGKEERIKLTQPAYSVKAKGFDDASYTQGTLVCIGDMNETNPGQGRSQRRKHYIILPKDSRASRIPIPREVVRAYLVSLSTYQQKSLKAWSGGVDSPQGCLAEGKPVFYITDNPQAPKQVLYFGHNPNFRITAKVKGNPTTPFDFVPKSIRMAEEPDFADTMFGWVEEKDWGPTVKGAYAGRVFVGDAHCTSTENIWYSQEPITPHILASPKVTTFQHYLVQNGDPHHPDQKVTLAHYGTSPKETEVRGHKLYWHKGKDPDIGANDKEKGKPSQLTQIRPVAAGVQFTFKIRFENLHPAELGALWWALTLPGSDGGDYRHKLGMGKPLGMGAVKITPTLHLSQRHEKTENEKSLPGRYDRLFQDGGWFTPSDDSKQGSDFIENFYTHMKSHSVDVSTSERIAMLLEMLRWRGDEPDTNWLDETRYMEIEHGREKINEYKERPVLPTPTGVVESLDKPLTKPDCAQRDKAQQRAAQHGNRR